VAGVLRFIILVSLVIGTVILVARLLQQVEGRGPRQRRKWASGRGPVRFDTPEDATGGTTPDLSGQTDAFTGEPLDAHRSLYRCDDCGAIYHADTFALLAREHGGRCVACRGRSIRPLAHAGRRVNPD
jgi:DNA-directed RNA polymerase subunit RPC12/RpoP